MANKIQHYIQVGTHRIALPEGVSLGDWSLEKVRTQNPRLRIFLACFQQLEHVSDSNYAILHCSQARLLEIWRKVREVSRLTQSKLEPTLQEHSLIPSLDNARLNTLNGYEMLNRTVLAVLEEYPQHVSASELPDVRRLLCTSIRQIQSFLRDSFSELMAADPRSSHDADYYLSTKFPQEIEAAEGLYGAVFRLNERLRELEPIWTKEVHVLREKMRQEQMIPNRDTWNDAESIMNLLVTGLTPHLREITALKGLRFKESQPMDEYTFGITYLCKMIGEVFLLGRDLIDKLKSLPATTFDQREQRVAGIVACHQVTIERLNELLGWVESHLQDLSSYVPSWLKKIESRRALMLGRGTVPAPPEEALRSEAAIK